MNARHGFSLVELTISVLMLSILLLGVGGLVVRTQQNYNESLQATRASEAVRTAETAITTILKTAGADPTESGGGLIDADYSGHAIFDSFRAVADFNPADGDFTDMLEDVRVYLQSDTIWVQWSASTDPQPVAFPIDSLRFEYYDANKTLITAPAQIATDAISVKVILQTATTMAAANYRSETWVFLRNQ